MEVKHGGVLLFFVYVIREVSGRHTSHVSHLLDHLNLSSNRNPLVVVMTPKDNIQYSSEYDDLYIRDDAATDDKEATDEAKYLLYEYLLRTGDPQNTEEIKEDDQKAALREALRARCQARVECEKKCDDDSGRDKKKYCPVNCKAVFDRLNLCDPPKEEKKTCKKEKDTCGKRGHTMPPKWFK